MTSPGGEGILDPDAAILWQGQPDAANVLEIDDAPQVSIFLASQTRRNRNSPRQVAVRFERIPDGRAVLAQIRDIQKGFQ
ncbi:MAG: hypothetical protein Q8P60_03220 [Pseudorhodobacter sp.]|nr:hypothetical protein [Pseudorhodobacter sp.]